MIIWQGTELSIVDENGMLIEDRGAGIPWVLELDMSRYLPLDPVESVPLESVTANLWRRLRPAEVKRVTQARKVQVGEAIVGTVVGMLAEIPLPALEAGNFYQVELISIASGVAWTRTREVRCPE